MAWEFGIEKLKSLGLELGTVDVARAGRKASTNIDKILAKCDADLKAINENGGKLIDAKGKKFMWRGANNGMRQINAVIDNLRWEEFSIKVKNDAAAVIDAIKKIKQTVEEAAKSSREKAQLENMLKVFMQPHLNKRKAAQAKRKAEKQALGTRGKKLMKRR